jgi:hypothetical protein
MNDHIMDNGTEKTFITKQQEEEFALEREHRLTIANHALALASVMSGVMIQPIDGAQLARGDGTYITKLRNELEESLPSNIIADNAVFQVNRLFKLLVDGE